MKRPTFKDIWQAFLSVVVLACIVIAIGLAIINSHPVKTIKAEEFSTARLKKEGIQVLTIGNHQYLWISTGSAAGLCHYEDCEYCKTIKNNKTNERDINIQTQQ